jgi:hypothetical protein
MLSSWRNKAWVATLAVGGLLLIGTAAARADDAKSPRGDHRREAKSGGPSARSNDRGREDSSVGSREYGHGRTHAAGGQDGSREEKVADTSHESSRGHRGGGHWAHSRGHGGRESSHHRASMHWKHGRGGQHWGNHARSSHGRRFHSAGWRHHGHGGHHSKGHGRGEHHRHAHHGPSSHRDS